jgi:YVTN family beta-propeller protein
MVISCGTTNPDPTTALDPASTSTAPPTTGPPPEVSTPTGPSTAPVNVYGAAGANMLDPLVASVPPRVYVPNSDGNTVTVIDPTTFTVLFSYPTGKGPQHVVPSHDLKSLWVNNDGANTLTQIDPTTAKPTRTIPTAQPYNLYWTPDGQYGIVMAEASQQMTFLDATTMDKKFAITTDCKGLNHLDFSADGRYALVSCEFAGKVIKVDMLTHQQVGTLPLGPATNMPQDVRLAPDGSVFYVADMMAGGVWVVNGATLTEEGFIPTGTGAHGIYFDRPAHRMFVTNRGSNQVYGKPHGPGSISVLDWATRTVTATWPIPGGGSPDMGNLSPDGTQLWLSGRFDNEVYALDTTNGALLARIPSGPAPHGLTYWPQPGKYSLGHTGIMR